MPKKNDHDLLNAFKASAGASETQEVEQAWIEIKACLDAGVDPFSPPRTTTKHDPLFYGALRECPAAIIKKLFEYAIKNRKSIDFSTHQKGRDGKEQPYNLLQMTALTADPLTLKYACEYVDALHKADESLPTAAVLLNRPIIITDDGVSHEITLVEYMASYSSSYTFLHYGIFSREDKRFILRWASNTSEESIATERTKPVEVVLDCMADAIFFLQSHNLVDVAEAKAFHKDKTKVIYFPQWIEDVEAASHKPAVWGKVVVRNRIDRLSHGTISEIFPNGFVIELNNFSGKDPLRFRVTFNREKIIKLALEAEAAAEARDDAAEAKAAADAEAKARSSGSSSGSSPVRRESIEKLKAKVSDLGEAHAALRRSHDDLKDSLIQSIDAKFQGKLSSDKARKLYAELRKAFSEYLAQGTSRVDFTEFFRNKQIDLVAGAGIALAAIAVSTVAPVVAPELTKAAGGLLVSRYQAERSKGKREEAESAIIASDTDIYAEDKIAMMVAFNFVKAHEEKLEAMPEAKIKPLREAAVEQFKAGIVDLATPPDPRRARGRGEARDRSNPVAFLTGHIEEGTSHAPRRALGWW